MIVNPTPTGWEVIYHRAHALLAGQIAAHWRADERPARWFETLAAITQHDDGGREWEGDNHLTESGAPLDFRLSTSSALVQPVEVTTNAQYQGRYVALLTSMHMTLLYGSFDTPQHRAFCAEQQANQKRWLAALELSPDEAEHAYSFLRWSDQLSLILCQRAVPDGERALEIGVAPGGAMTSVRQRLDETLTVEPYPFEAERFTVGIEATYLEQMTFKNDPALQAALRSAPIRPLTWTFAR